MATRYLFQGADIKKWFSELKRPNDRGFFHMQSSDSHAINGTSAGGGQPAERNTIMTVSSYFAHKHCANCGELVTRSAKILLNFPVGIMA